MDELLISLLEQVRDGELSEAEAESRYERFIARVPLDSGKAKVNEHAPDEEGAYAYRRVENINPAKQATCRLFIFLPFGFGNETASFSWRRGLEGNPDLDLWFIGASNHNSWSSLIDHLVDKVVSLCDIPFMVYGHSMGAIVAYEVLVALQTRYQLSPRVFIPSSVPPPKSFSRLKYIAPFYNIDDAMPKDKARGILEKSQIILSKTTGILSVTDAALHCDIALVKSYRFETIDNVDNGHKRLECPIFALQANNDILVKDATAIEAWREYTSGDFNFREVEGTHLYFLNPPSSVFSLLLSYTVDHDKKQHVDSLEGLQTFFPKAYKLCSFEAGTEEVSTFPYGLEPQGYLIYQPDGHMAAHIWNAARDLCDASHSERSEAERFLSYLSYTGRYSISSGVISHDISASTDPNLEGDCMTRYWQPTAQGIVLNTAPLTTAHGVQSKSSAYCSLRWKTISSTCAHGSDISGTWRVTVHRKNGGEQRDVKGHMMFTDNGLFSLVVSECNRKRFHYDNNLLANDDEIHDAIGSVSSLCGRYKRVGLNRWSVFTNADLEAPEDRSVGIHVKWWRDKTIMAVRLNYGDAKHHKSDVYICERAQY
ncbi:MAG: lipocalin-like domain-containing protein [Agarilytica sp.]